VIFFICLTLILAPRSKSSKKPIYSKVRLEVSLDCIAPSTDLKIYWWDFVSGAVGCFFEL